MTSKFIKPRKQNKYDLNGEYGIGYTSNTNEEFYFDLEDYDLIKRYYWHKSIGGYLMACGRPELNDKKHVKLHKLVVNYTIVDHYNRNKLDNRKKNLKDATIEGNNRNRPIFKNNISGIMGLNYYKHRKSWKASLSLNGESIFLGYYKNKDDAIKARLEGEIKYFGAEFAPQRHLFEHYEICMEERKN